uniref:Uncharacterized protein n=1 Tax=Helianthus annuus TaxID=4232 RepID=A0A251SFT7_HELAN
MSRLHFQNYGTVGIGETMGIQVLSGVHFLEVLANCFRCAMKIPVQSRHALIISGMTFTLKHSLVLTFFLLAFLFTTVVPSYALAPACLGNCNVLKEDCLQLCRRVGFLTGACRPGIPPMCCCHD